MTAFAGRLLNAKILNLNNLHVTDEKTIIEDDDRFLIDTTAEKIYLNDLDTLNTVMRFLPDRTGKESGKLVTSLRNKIPTETLTTLNAKNWKIVDLVAQYRYDVNTYEDLLPEFNTEFTSDKYEVYDSVSEIVIDNIVWEEGTINPADGKDSPLSGRLRTNFLPVLPNITYKTSGNSINFHWYDSNKTYIASGHKYASSCVSPTNAKYVRFHNSTNEVNVISAKLITRSIESKNGDLPTLMRFGGTEDSNSYSSLIEVFDLNTKELTDCSYMFGKCCNVKNIRAYWNTSNVTNIRAMFYRCNNLTSLDVSNWDTSSVTNMSGIFSGGDLSDTSLIEIVGLETWDTSSVLDMSLMFYNRKSLTTLDVSKFDTSKVTTMNNMFQNCSMLAPLDLSNFDTSSVTNMSNMFFNCKNLTQLDVSNFDTSSVTNMRNMFSGCKSLTQLDVSNFNTSNVTNMEGMFTNCTNLTQLDVSNFDTSKVTTMGYMFNSCTNLTQLDVSNFDTSQVTTMRSMFNSCTNLTQLDASNFNTSNVAD
ncbi:MAG: BspA family leucine-rich repeat surface protein, partial [Bacilli bacterium]|nr:BspA family leucine-rich repeat surface protein [Bacilli bacterium]